MLNSQLSFFNRNICLCLQVSSQQNQKWRLLVYFNVFEVMNSNRFFCFTNQISYYNNQKWMFFENLLIFFLHYFQMLNSFLLECQNTFLYKWSNFLSSKLPSFLDWSNSLCLQLLNTILNKCRLGMRLQHFLLHQWFLCFSFQISYQNKNEFGLHHYFIESNSFFL